MSESVVYLIASIIVIIAWGGNSSALVSYSLWSPWQATLVGRSLMYRNLSMWLLLTYALTSRWLNPVPDLQYALGLGIYALIALVEWYLFLVLRAVQTGRITVDHPNYSPLRDWIRARRVKREKADHG